MEDYEEKMRGTSLLEIHQEKMKNEKNGNKGNFAYGKRDDGIKVNLVDRKKFLNVGTVDSKRALSIMQDKKGLQGRFGNKEKHMGF